MRRFAAATPLVLALSLLPSCTVDLRDAAGEADLVGQHDPAAAAPTTVPQVSIAVLNCLHQPQIRPDEIVLTCVDNNMIIDGIRWDSWTEAGAHGQGTESRSVCHPDCASAPRQSFPVTIELSAPANGVFTSLTKTPHGGIPEVLPLAR